MSFKKEQIEVCLTPKPHKKFWEKNKKEERESRDGGQKENREGEKDGKKEERKEGGRGGRKE